MAPSPAAVRRPARCGAQAIALGHTQDDVLETLLMRVIQGSDVEGSARDAPSQGPIPQAAASLHRGRRCCAYLRGARPVLAGGPSNRDTRFLRNRVSSLLVPVLERSFPGYRTGMLTLARKLAHRGGRGAGGGRRAALGTDRRRLFDRRRGILRRARPRSAPASLLLLYDRFRAPDVTATASLAFPVARSAACEAVPEGHDPPGTRRRADGPRRKAFLGTRSCQPRQKGILYRSLRSRIYHSAGDGMRLTFVHRTGKRRRGAGGDCRSFQGGAAAGVCQVKKEG